MAEELFIDKGSKESIYRSLLPQIKSLTEHEPDLIANLANISAVLNSAFDFLWVGFYLIKGDELVLGPFQGSIACTRIKKGRGVCGVAWERKASIVVSDVDVFPGHIACSSLSRSEIVIPLLKNNEIYGVLDIDSDQLDSFDDIDRLFLEQICTYL